MGGSSEPPIFLLENSNDNLMGFSFFE